MGSALFKTYEFENTFIEEHKTFTLNSVWTLLYSFEHVP